MRPSLAGKKRQKVRKVREREGVAVEMLFARDFERLARRWSFDRLGEAATRTTQSDV
jgi:hypothetical protein